MAEDVLVLETDLPVVGANGDESLEHDDTVVGAQSFALILSARRDPDDGSVSVKSTLFEYQLKQEQIMVIFRPLGVDCPGFRVKALAKCNPYSSRVQRR